MPITIDAFSVTATSGRVGTVGAGSGGTAPPTSWLIWEMTPLTTGAIDGGFTGGGLTGGTLTGGGLTGGGVTGGVVGVAGVDGVLGVEGVLGVDGVEPVLPLVFVGLLGASRARLGAAPFRADGFPALN